MTPTTKSSSLHNEIMSATASRDIAAAATPGWTSSDIRYSVQVVLTFTVHVPVRRALCVDLEHTR